MEVRGTPSDGGQGPIVRNVAERFGNIRFAIVTGDRDFRQSPIVRYTTKPDPARVPAAGGDARRSPDCPGSDPAAVRME